MIKIKSKTTRSIVNFIGLTIGSIVTALALQWFLVPNLIIDGGITGLSIIFSKLWDIPLSFLVIVLNVPLFFIGVKHLGKRFFIHTTYSMLCFSLFLSYFEMFPPATEEMLLATVFGGALLGIGVGLIIRFGACNDGTESVAIVISKKSSFSVGEVVLVFNIIIYAIAGSVFGLDRAMYSMLTYIIAYKVVDFISEGLEQAKAAMIITNHGNKLSKEIYQRLGRTTTTIKGKGLISGEKEVLYCVITRVEIFELKHIVEELDESAFVTITDVSDIIGTHIKSTNRFFMKEKK